MSEAKIIVRKRGSLGTVKIRDPRDPHFGKVGKVEFDEVGLKEIENYTLTFEDGNTSSYSKKELEEATKRR